MTITTIDLAGKLHRPASWTSLIRAFWGPMTGLPHLPLLSFFIPLLLYSLPTSLAYVQNSDAVVPAPSNHPPVLQVRELFLLVDFKRPLSFDTVFLAFRKLAHLASIFLASHSLFHPYNKRSLASLSKAEAIEITRKFRFARKYDGKSCKKIILQFKHKLFTSLYKNVQDSSR